MLGYNDLGSAEVVEDFESARCAQCGPEVTRPVGRIRRHRFEKRPQLVGTEDLDVDCHPREVHDDRVREGQLIVERSFRDQVDVEIGEHVAQTVDERAGEVERVVRPEAKSIGKLGDETDATR